MADNQNVNTNDNFDDNNSGDDKNNQNFRLPDQEKFSELLKYIHVPETITIDTLNEKDDVEEMNSYFSMKKRIYEETLAPELVENEKTKRLHKKLVVQKLFKLLKWQFIATYVSIFMMIIIIACSNILSIETSVLKSMFSFMKFYITSVLAELVAILFFIVKQVFDKSIVELFKNFDKDGNVK